MSAPPALAWRLALVLAIAGPLCAAVDAAGQASQNASAAGTALPLGKRGEVVATSLYSRSASALPGACWSARSNAVDLLARDPFFGGWGIHRFQNLAFVAPPSGLVPPVIMGAVLVAAKAPWSYTFMVYDPGDRTSRDRVDDLFRTGVNAQGGATWTGAVAGPFAGGDGYSSRARYSRQAVTKLWTSLLIRTTSSWVISTKSE